MSVHHLASADAFGAQILAAGRFLAAVIAAPFAALARSARIRRTAAQLENLDDRTLLDIGLQRSQISPTARHAVDWPHLDPRRLAR